MKLARLPSKLKRFLFNEEGFFSGPYATWEDALARAQGYGDPAIFEKVKLATLQAKENDHLFVRDGIIFSSPQYSYPMLAALLKIAAENKGRLRVLDFGGGLGASYYGFRNYCNQLDLRWFIVEQESMVDIGKSLFTDEVLSFYADVTALPEQPDLIILSASLQYLKTPFAVLDKLFTLKSPYLFLDRTWFNDKNEPDCILVEHVPAHIYQSSYPCWLLNYSHLLAYLMPHYLTLFEFLALEGKFTSKRHHIASKGFFMRRRAS